MDPINVKEHKARTKDETKTNHWTLHARKYTSVQANYYRKNVETIREKNRQRYANNPEVREKTRERSRIVREQKKNYWRTKKKTLEGKILK
jgi:hypothetical protein